MCAHANLFTEQLNEAFIIQIYEHMSYLVLDLPAQNSSKRSVQWGLSWLEGGGAAKTLQNLNFIPTHPWSVFQMS